MEVFTKLAGIKIIRKSLLPLVALALFIAAYINYKLNIRPFISQALQQDLSRYIGTFFVICVVLTLQRIAEVILDWYKGNIAVKTETKLDDKLIPLLARTLKVAFWVIALMVILPFYGVNISALVAALGVASLAIALAAQDTIANIIAGYLIMIDSPFVIGNKIKLPSGEIVQVLDVGVRRSKFLAEDKAIIFVPNVNLSKNKIINYTYGEKFSKQEAR